MQQPAPRRIRHLTAATISAALLLTPAPARPQTAEPRPPAPHPLKYDVVSVKWNKTGDPGTDITFSDHASLSTTNVTVKMLVEAAFRMRRHLVLDVPKWAQEERFDVEAKVVDPDPAVVAAQNEEDRTAMLQALLADRFHLKAHMETRILPLYELVVNKAGSKMTPADPAVPGSSMKGGRGDLTGKAARMDLLANVLSNELSSVVLNKTELPGRYNFHLKYNMEENSIVSHADTGAAEAPSIYTAVQEQLGLKLQPAKGPVQVLVVDSVDRPTEN